MSKPTTASRKGAKVKEHLKRIWRVLPSDSIDTIAADADLTYNQANHAISHLRANAVEFGWTIPHVKRGATKFLKGDAKARFVPVLLEPNDDEMETYSEENHHPMVIAGLHSTCSEVGRKSANEATAVRIAAASLTKDQTEVKAAALDFAADLDYVSRQARRVGKEVVAPLPQESVAIEEA